FRAPVAGGEIDHAGVGSIRVFGEWWGSPAREHVLGQVEPARACRKIRCVVCVELVEGVEPCELDAGDLVQAFGRDFGVKLLLCRDRALIAIAEGRSERTVVGVKADVVDGPAIDGDGADTFWGKLGGATETVVDTGFDCGDGPAKAVVFNGAVGKAVDERDLGSIALPA